MLKFINRDEQGKFCVVISAVYDHKRCVLYTGDEKGFVKAWSFEDIIEIVNISPLSKNGKKNKFLSFGMNGITLSMPIVTPRDVCLIF